MSAHCASPIPWATLVDYWARDLADDELDAVEAHVFECAQCTETSTRIAAITEPVREMIPMLLRPEQVASLSARIAVAENRMSPDERREVPFPAVGVLLHRLTGLDLTGAVRVGFTLRGETTAKLMVSHPDAPVDRERGEIILACQRHFAVLGEPDTVAEVRVRDAAGEERVTRYTILHRPPV